MIKVSSYLKDKIQEFINYLKSECGISENTINSYTLDLSQFTEFLNSKNIYDFKNIRYPELELYIKYLYSLGLKTSSITRKISTIRNFFAFLFNENYIQENPTRDILLPKKRKLLPKILSPEEIVSLASKIDVNKKLELRNRAMLELLFATGMRVSELINLKVNDINLEKKYLICKGKGEKRRVIPFSETTKKWLKKYISVYKDEISSSIYLFFNSKGEKLTRQRLWEIIKDLRIKSGLKKQVSPHVFRHSFATQLLEGGADLRSVQEMLGHSSITITQLYTHMSLDKMRRIYDETHPRA